MDWVDLLPPWGLVILALVAAVIAALLRNRFHIKEIEIPLPFVKVKAEPVKEKGKEEPTVRPPPPRRSRTIQEAKATGGAKGDVEQSAPQGAAATQKAAADGEGTELKLKQTIR